MSDDAVNSLSFLGELLLMEKQPHIEFSASFKGAITYSDLLSTEGTLAFVTDQASIQRGGFLFQVDGFDFVFSLSFQNNQIVFQRNNIVSVLSLEELLAMSQRVHVFVMWTQTELKLDCRAALTTKEATVPTTPTAPSSRLINWIRKRNLLPTTTYPSEEALREKVYSTLNSVNQKIREADAYKSFWNIMYEGNTIIERKPKREIEIQPLIHCLLSDQMLMSNIEILPEHKTGEGNLDFLFIGQVNGLGLCKICAEFKLAHSHDLDNGLWEQLPKYMEVSNAQYGAYCVLNFKGDWFTSPSFKEGEALDMHLTLIPKSQRKAVHSQIRSFIFDMNKPATASKRA